MAMFCALPRIGPRLTILLTQCLGAPIAGCAEYFFLGTVPTLPQIACAGVILSGVGLALAPDTHSQVEPGAFRWGLLFGGFSALGQGLGAVISRKANEVANAHGQWVDGGTAAYQRILAGVLFTLLGWAVLRMMKVDRERAAGREVWVRAAPLIVGNALSGPVAGVACFQWALISSPSAVVLPIVSMSPLVTMALAWGIEGVRPRMRACVGGGVAVAGAAGLAWLKAMAA
jgi:drug/metabolite transporter (DMT)-like permease